MKKRILNKYIFLLIVALLIIVTYVWKWTTDDKEQQNPNDELFDESQHDTTQPPTLQENKIDEALVDKPDGNMNTTKEKEDSYETAYQKRFGSQAVTKAKEQAKQELALYLSHVSDWDKWQGVVTGSFLKKVKNDIPAVKEANVKRHIESIELFASNPSQSKNMTFGAFATWQVTSNGRITNQRTQLFYVTVISRNGKWLVNNMVTPNDGMEGKRDT
ncbi:hypothetical protein [Virgibacillus salexigens]|uniref:hypothetical protein n=1 Tax=Virgibacillus salexigens TaxID=61016 RepID=UPI00190C282D|nr:hypothetical protein [Virgibacillus salexigens]